MRQIFLILFVLLAQGCSHVFYQPSSRQFVDPAQFKLKYENIWFNTPEGTKLHGWFFRTTAKKTKGTIVQFHGNAQNISTHFFSLIWLIQEGYNLFTFDYPGYGKSEGEPSQKTVYHSALLAFDKGLELHQREGGGKFVIYGQSLGGAISLRALPDWKNFEKVNLIVMDSSFSSYKGIAFDKLTDRWFLWPFAPLTFLLVSDEYASDKVFKKITRPTLVIVGMKDEIIPPKFGKEIYKGVKTQEKWLWKLPNGRHIDAYHHDEGKYRKQFLDLLDSLPSL